MHNRTLSTSLLISLAILTCLVSATPAQAEFKKVKFDAVDGVTLHGRFYAGKAADSPVVLLLHQLGGKSTLKTWTGLAEALNANGFAVLAFDFRGHGASKEVDPTIFWQVKANVAGVKGGARLKSTSIEHTAFSPDYYPILINDIAAAKSFLDRKNDARECNASSLMVIGAETGATLGAIWLNAEYHRYPVKLNMFGLPLVAFGRFVADTTQPPEGENTICAVWLSISPRLSKLARPISLAGVLELPVKSKGMAMAFMYGTGDKEGKKLATLLENKLVVFKKGTKEKERENRYKFTGAVPIPDTTLKGANLLSKATNQAIVEHLNNVVADRGKEWVDRDFRKTPYVWVLNPLNPQANLSAKNPNETNFIFNTYTMFIGR